MAAERHLLFGLLALQNGLIDQGALVAAFQAWTRDKARSLADLLVSRGDLDADACAGLEAIMAVHVRKHGDVESSLAAVPADRSTRAGLAGLGEPEIEATLARVAGPRNGQAAGFDGDGDDDDPDRTAGLSLGAATGDGQRFRVLRPHARGGLGEVFVALDAELHREVALKQILEKHADDPISRQRFVAEAEITGGLEHPGIVPVYGLGTFADGRPYYAMRFIRGDSLKEAIARFHADETLESNPGRRSLELRKLLRRFLDVCNAVDYAHSRGVIHRDIKPANIILGKHGETLVVDWGLAKAVGRADPAVGEQTIAPSSSGLSETLPGSALGTPAYMSPEQARGDLVKLGRPSDIYSLGATLYCLLTGSPPFEGDEIGDLLHAVQEGRFRPPQAIDPTIDGALEAVCLRAMATDPAGRYPSVRAMAEDVERWMADEPVSARREPFGERVRRWVRRNRTVAAAVTAAALVGVIGLSAILAVQAQSNAALATSNAALAEASAGVEARYALAMDAVKTFYTGVSEDFLLKEPQFKHLRTQLLMAAGAFYQRLGGLLQRRTDSASRRALGQANFELAELTDLIGDKQAALAEQRRVLAFREVLAAGPGAGVETREDLGRSLVAVGRLLALTGRNAEALDMLARVRSIAAGSTTPALRGVLAASLYWTGLVHRESGRSDEARQAYEESRAIRHELTRIASASIEARRELSWCANDMGLMMGQAGQPTEALAFYDESRRLKQSLVDDYPTVAEYRRDLAITYYNIGILQAQNGKHAAGLAAYQKALAICQALAEASPAVRPFQSELANCLIETGDVYRQLGQMGQAREAYEQALARVEGLVKAEPTATREQAELVQVLRGLGAVRRADGQAADAVAALRRAATVGSRLRSDSGETLYYLAGCHALLGAFAGTPASGLSAEDGAAELDRAMELLHRSVAAGYHPVEWMRRDPDLDALRGRPDFRRLMTSLSHDNHRDPDGR